MRNGLMIVVAALMLTAGLVGCGGSMFPHRPSELPPVATQPSGQAGYMSTATVRDTERDSEDLPSLAMQYLQKYTEAQEKVVKLQQENRDLTDKQQKLLEQSAKMQSDLAASQGQLRDANAMLMELRQELEKWKGNVLGFRQEMRDAQQAQINALARIMKLLGGEAPASTTQPANEAMSAAKGGARETTP